MALSDPSPINTKAFDVDGMAGYATYTLADGASSTTSATDVNQESDTGAWYLEAGSGNAFDVTLQWRPGSNDGWSDVENITESDTNSSNTYENGLSPVSAGEWRVKYNSGSASVSVQLRL